MNDAATPKSPVTYRLLLEDGTVRDVLVADDSDGLVGPCFRAKSPDWHGDVVADTARGAAVKVAAHSDRAPSGAGVGLPVVAVLAPGEESPLDVRRERDDLRRLAALARSSTFPAPPEPPLLTGVAVGPALVMPDGTWRVSVRLDPPPRPDTSDFVVADALNRIRRHRDAYLQQRGPATGRDEYVAGIDDCLRLLIPLASKETP